MSYCSDDEVVVVDFWCLGFGMKVRIALNEKGIKYKCKEEDITKPKRSQVVLEMNPVRKSVPILIHKGRPVCDSSVILEYIEETWKEGYCQLLPSDPYKKAVARFWAHFIDNKMFNTQVKFLKSKDGAKEEIKKELIADLKQLEELLGEQEYFAGNEFGFLDIVLIPYSTMFYGYEHHGNFKLEAECPKISAWVERCRKRESVSDVLADDVEMYEIHKNFYGIE